MDAWEREIRQVEVSGCCLDFAIGIVVKKCYGVRCRRWFMVDLVFLGGIVTRDSENLAMRDERMLSG